uniref:Uncharacterized protein n=1 Tax=Steinernema glaseri TaxID=37863 RepID=A0A1I7ZS02_9BILA
MFHLRMLWILAAVFFFLVSSNSSEEKQVADAPGGHPNHPHPHPPSSTTKGPGIRAKRWCPYCDYYFYW